MGRQTSMFTRIIVLTMMFLSFRVCLCSSTDTITFDQPLKDGDLLISNAKSFALGFFTPGKNSTGGKRYVGIWYRKIPDQLVVWVANRNNPVNGTSGILFIDSTGNLVIQDNKTNVSVWSTSLSFPTTGINLKAYSAKLQETGNLVLYHDHPDSRATPWQSFDYPTNTILPNMKIGVDKKTGLERFVTSWKSPDDPSPGEYVLRWELKGMPQSIVYKDKTQPVWRIGSWNGVRWSGIPEMTSNINSYIYIENQDEVSMQFLTMDPSVYTIVMVNESGAFSKIIWQGDDEMKRWVGIWYFPQDNCDFYAHCGSFSVCNAQNLEGFPCKCLPGFKPKSSKEWGMGDGRNGCQRNNTEVCHNGEGFARLESMKIPDTETAEVNRGIGLEECKERCLNNCSCTAYASSNISYGGSGCITWYGELIDMREFTKGGQDMYIRVSASDLAQPVKKSKGLGEKRLTATVIVPIAAVILVLFCFILKIREGKKPPSNTTSSLLSDEGTADVLTFDFNTIEAATDNFSEDNKLGEGGFGSVYKGKLQNGQLLAVKRLTRTSLQGIVEFKNEVMLIAKLQHRNLVRLLGCCVQQGEKMLVYEYLPNKSLDSFIFDNREGMSLDWRKRFEIISGIAQGILYLHQDSRLKIIHRDLKASNVLLDASMQPKISDFGMTRIFKEEQVEANTNRVVGTYGYMSPKYAMEGHFSVKSDVFSFGVLMLEIVCGKKNKYKRNQNSLNLIGDVWDLWNEERSMEIVDPSLGESYDGREVLRCIHVGLLCVQLYPNDRPIMSDVIFMLSNDIELARPKPPGFIFNQENTVAPFSYSKSNGGNQSINTMSITELVGR
ncbi:PREDICTED: G-type lectin S-receptor-like serine/threonine-protein kinase At1g11410 isoform X2 [Ipomoea nil]|uniref:G-type lectin S-receptor-like serine/threonine-protein kinase At1g11410 isoform X2 n=1 Tax=Ipomoea nil TaxID=35883 RepID=UPI0009011239|nr:PREDICTED: G-type lectin S-receptor-like serine/threonine-protein kinase At1g11410 isoform X2 [Ipomoea nil]